ncbi:unnamed protein product [Pleuronectes platessa]|uniref:Uncharacterized protein n=1 Tax=Pleuronectes platessa TaxID=8262 RepID=A0A9N7TZ30_PLEPL|nr:unnamed protein product [Pleuronectes platessa]
MEIGFLEVAPHSLACLLVVRRPRVTELHTERQAPEQSPVEKSAVDTILLHSPAVSFSSCLHDASETNVVEILRVQVRSCSLEVLLLLIVLRICEEGVVGVQISPGFTVAPCVCPWHKDARDDHSASDIEPESP